MAVNGPPRLPHTPPGAPQRVPAAHVRNAIAATAQARLDTAGRQPAPHVLRAQTHPPPPSRVIPPPVQAAQARLAVVRPPAPHVQAALAGVAQARPVAVRPPAQHVQAAITSAAQARLSQNQPARPGGGQPAAPRPAEVVQRMEEHRPWERDNKKNTLFHRPRSSSPLRKRQRKILKRVREDMIDLNTKNKRAKLKKPQPKRTVQGNIGEFTAEMFYTDQDIMCLDANREIQKNIPGIDHILQYDDQFCFSQSKLHLPGESKTTLQELAEEYKRRIDEREKDALDFLKRVVKGNKIGELEDLNDQLGSNLTLTLIIEELKDTEKGYDPDEVNDMDTSQDAVKWAADAILFPVPGDVYDILPTSYKARAVRLEQDTDWFASTLRKSYYMDTKTQLTKKQREKLEDEDYIPDE